MKVGGLQGGGSSTAMQGGDTGQTAPAAGVLKSVRYEDSAGTW